MLPNVSRWLYGFILFLRCLPLLTNSIKPTLSSTIAMIFYIASYFQSYKSLVPMQHLCWQLAKNIRFTNQKVFSLIRGQLIRSLAFCKMVANLSTSRGKQLKPQPRAKGEITHYCTLCEVCNVSKRYYTFFWTVISSDFFPG